MLCDDIVQNRDNDMIIEPFSGVLDRVPRFVLDASATGMIADLARRSDWNLFKVLPLCRMPYEAFWVEFSGADFPEGSGFPRHKKLGFLFDSFANSDENFVVYPVWTEIDDRVTSVPMALAFHNSAEGDAEALAEIVRLAKAATGVDFLKYYPAGENDYRLLSDARVTFFNSKRFEHLWPTVVRELTESRVHEMVRYQVRTFSTFVWALLVVLNSRNLIKIQDSPDFTKLDKKRKRSGKPALLSHRPITLNLSPGLKRRFVSGLKGNGPAGAHIVRGHFKIRKSGIYWWSPYVRGGTEAETARTYKVTSKPALERMEPVTDGN